MIAMGNHMINQEMISYRGLANRQTVRTLAVKSRKVKRETADALFQNFPVSLENNDDG